MSALLMYGDTERSADLFHAIPVSIGDPFLYAEIDGRKVAVVGALEHDNILGLGLGIEIIPPSEIGLDDLLEQGLEPFQIASELAVRACTKLSITSATVHPTFPVAIADHLRSSGVKLNIDQRIFQERRRVKTAAELAGIRRAQKAADAAMRLAAQLIRDLPQGLTSEQVRAEMQRVCREHDCVLEDIAIVAHGEQSARGHDRGSGAITRGEPVLVDIWPYDKASHCFADMSRTFVAGGGSPPDELLEYWTLTRASIEAVMPAIRAGADCHKLYELSCQPFEDAGQPTLRSKPKGESLNRGFFHSLGHGVGIEVHEPPRLGGVKDTLVAGEVITIEPGCYRPGFGGCRLEDLVLVTEDGCEVLTDFPYEL